MMITMWLLSQVILIIVVELILMVVKALVLMVLDLLRVEAVVKVLGFHVEM